MNGQDIELSAINGTGQKDNEEPQARNQAPEKTATDDRDARKERIVAWFENLFTTGGSLGAFFAGFTLNIATSDSTKPWARTCAAVSSLLFVFTVLLCAACGLVVALYRPDVKKRVARDGNPSRAFNAVSLLLQLMLLTAVLFFFLVMKESVEVVGLIGVVFTGVAILAAIVICGKKFIPVKPQGAAGRLAVS